MNNTELYHHGVLGQKWGVRRYQNSDGTLTPSGKQRITKLSENKIEKKLTKAIHDKRASEHGSSNRWMSTTDIGPNSKEAYKRYREGMQSEEYIKKANQLGELNKQYDDYIAGKTKTFDFKAARELKDSLSDIVGMYTTGRGYTKIFMETIGKDLSVSKLQDLGYDETEAEAIVDRLLEVNRTLAFK